MHLTPFALIPCILPRVINGEFKLEADKRPRVMQRHSGNRIFWCIYRVNGDTLQWCTRQGSGPGDLPTNFATDVDEDVYLLMFRREVE